MLMCDFFLKRPYIYSIMLSLRNYFGKRNTLILFVPSKVQSVLEGYTLFKFPSKSTTLTWKKFNKNTCCVFANNRWRYFQFYSKGRYWLVVLWVCDNPHLVRQGCLRYPVAGTPEVLCPAPSYRNLTTRETWLPQTLMWTRETSDKEQKYQIE